MSENKDINNNSELEDEALDRVVGGLLGGQVNQVADINDKWVPTGNLVESQKKRDSLIRQAKRTGDFF